MFWWQSAGKDRYNAVPSVLWANMASLTSPLFSAGLPKIKERGPNVDFALTNAKAPTMFSFPTWASSNTTAFAHHGVGSKPGAMDHRAMAHMRTLLQKNGGPGKQQHTTFLNVAPALAPLSPNRAQHGMGTDVAIRTHRHMAHQCGPWMDECIGMHHGNHVTECKHHALNVGCFR